LRIQEAEIKKKPLERIVLWIFCSFDFNDTFVKASTLLLFSLHHPALFYPLLSFLLSCGKATGMVWYTQQTEGAKQFDLQRFYGYIFPLYL